MCSLRRQSDNGCTYREVEKLFKLNWMMQENMYAKKVRPTRVIFRDIR